MTKSSSAIVSAGEHMVMRSDFSSYAARDSVIDRLLDWAEEAKLAGRESRAGALLELAWFAFDQPVASRRAPPRPVSQTISRAFPGLADLCLREEVLT